MTGYLGERRLDGTYRETSQHRSRTLDFGLQASFGVTVIAAIMEICTVSGIVRTSRLSYG